MADKTSAGVDITLDRPRTLIFDLFALSELELRSEKHLGWFLHELAEGRCGPAVALWMLWAGLQHETPRPTVMQVHADLRALLEDGRRLADVQEAIVIAVGRSEFFSPKRQSDTGTREPSSSTVLEVSASAGTAGQNG